jgi:HPt (histidine-containing phosphotransfer) domain-containing protein
LEQYQYINLSFLRHFAANKKEIMKMLIEIYLEVVPVEVEKMEKHIAEKNWKQVRVSAHTLKPQLSYMGIQKLEPVILAIEENAQQLKNVESIPALFLELKNGCTVTYSELKGSLAVL